MRYPLQAQSICAVLIDDLQRIDTVAEGFRHLSSLGISYEAVDKHGGEGLFARVLQRGEDHSCNPEEDNIITRYKGIGRVEILKVDILLRPAEG